MNELRPARKAFSGSTLFLSAFLIVSSVFQLLLPLIPQLIWGADNWFATSSWGSWLITFAPIYAIGFPITWLLFRLLPSGAPEKSKLGITGLLWAIPIMFFFMYAGNIIGIILSALLSCGKAQNTVVELATDNNTLVKTLVMVILAPLVEETVFRKLLIDRTHKYSEKVAVFVSALAFGLFHGNLFQFFYAFGIGLVLGYIYVRTGRLRYTVLLHCLMNFMGAVIAPWILSLLDPVALEQALITPTVEAFLPILPGMIVYLVYALFLLVLSITGFVLLIIKLRRLKWQEAPAQLPKGTCFKTVFLNVGMILFCLLCGILMALSLFVM